MAETVHLDAKGKAYCGAKDGKKAKSLAKVTCATCKAMAKQPFDY